VGSFSGFSISPVAEFVALRTMDRTGWHYDGSFQQAGVPTHSSVEQQEWEMMVTSHPSLDPQASWANLQARFSHAMHPGYRTCVSSKRCVIELTEMLF
jgi:hypothetical protein